MVEAKEVQREKAIESKEVLAELKSMIRENYVVLVEEKEGALILHYVNGQKFRLTLEEVR